MAKTYTIREASEATQVSTHTLRFYERIGLLQITRAENGHRRYTDSDLEWIHFVMLLRGVNMPLPEIATYMKLEKNGQTTFDKRLQMLATHRTELVRHITELQGYLSALDSKIDYYRNTPAEGNSDCVRFNEENTNGISSIRTNRHQGESPVLRVNDLWEQDG